MSRRVLVTGASGYTGSHVIRAFVKANWEVHAVVRAKSRLTYLKDLADQIVIHSSNGQFEDLQLICQQARCELVCHVAGISEITTAPKDIHRLIEANITFGVLVLEAALLSGCRKAIIASSYFVNFHGKDLEPNSLYAVTKLNFRIFADYYSKFRSLRYIELRLFDSFGPCDGRGKLLTLLDRAVESGKPLDMTEGAQMVAPIHIDDVAKAFVHANDLLDDDESHEYSSRSYAVPGPQSLSLHEVVKTYAKARKAQLDIRWGMIPYPMGQIMAPYIGDTLPGWIASVTLEEGLTRIYSIS